MEKRHGRHGKERNEANANASVDPAACQSLIDAGVENSAWQDHYIDVESEAIQGSGLETSLP
jgi:hypothetical protein